MRLPSAYGGGSICGISICGISSSGISSSDRIVATGGSITSILSVGASSRAGGARQPSEAAAQEIARGGGRGGLDV